MAQQNLRNDLVSTIERLTKIQKALPPTASSKLKSVYTRQIKQYQQALAKLPV